MTQIRMQSTAQRKSHRRSAHAERFMLRYSSYEITAARVPKVAENIRLDFGLSFVYNEKIQKKI